MRKYFLYVLITLMLFSSIYASDHLEIELPHSDKVFADSIHLRVKYDVDPVDDQTCYYWVYDEENDSDFVYGHKTKRNDYLWEVDKVFDFGTVDISRFNDSANMTVKFKCSSKEKYRGFVKDTYEPWADVYIWDTDDWVYVDILAEDDYELEKVESYYRVVKQGDAALPYDFNSPVMEKVEYNFTEYGNYTVYFRPYDRAGNYPDWYYVDFNFVEDEGVEVVNQSDGVQGGDSSSGGEGDIYVIDDTGDDEGAFLSELDVFELNLDKYFMFSVDNNLSEDTTVKVIAEIDSQREQVGYFEVEAYDDITEQFLISDYFENLNTGDSYRVCLDVLDIKESYLTSDCKQFVYGEATSDTDLIIDNVMVNSDLVTGDRVLAVDNGEKLDVEVVFTPKVDIDDMRVRVILEGYEHDDLRQSSGLINGFGDVQDSVNIEFQLPDDMEFDEEYRLKVLVATQDEDLAYKVYDLYVDTDRHKMDILDLVLTPSSGVEVGQNVFGAVRLKNMGSEQQSGVKVIIRVPELNITEYTYVDYIDSKQVLMTDDVMLYVNEVVEPGEYDLEVEVQYNDLYDSYQENYTLNVIKPIKRQVGNLTLSYYEDMNMYYGQEKTFLVTIENNYDRDLPVTLFALNNEWVDEVKITPSVIVLGPYESGDYRIDLVTYVDAGDYELKMGVKQGYEMVDEMVVNVEVSGGGLGKWINAILFVLITILFIVLIVVVFVIASKKNENGGEEEGGGEEVLEGEDYY